jgi:hypothetical protein
VGLPAGELAVAFLGDQPAQIPLWNGFLCLQPTLYRLPVTTADALGMVSIDLDLAAAPASVITAGSTWRFQTAYRDAAGGGAGINFSDGLALTFQP